MIQQNQQLNTVSQLPASPSRSAVWWTANADPFAMRARCGNESCHDGRRQG